MKRILACLLFSLFSHLSYAQAFDPIPFTLLAGATVSIVNPIPQLTTYISLYIASGTLQIKNHTPTGSAGCPAGLVIPSVQNRICTMTGSNVLILGSVRSTGEGVSGTYQIIIP